MICDLHCHTTSSDGVFTPAQVVRMAANSGIDIIAITDHDTVAGCREAERTIMEENLSVRLIKGVELSVENQEDEVHMLGLQIDDKNERLCQRLEEFKQDREKRSHKIIDKLSYLGYLVSMQDVLAQAGEHAKVLGRTHIAAALVAKSYFKNVSEVFDKLLYLNGPAYVPHLRPDLKEAIDLIHGAKGIAVLAHPYTVKNHNVLEEATLLGLDGIEAYYPRHSPEQLNEYKNFARKKGLKVSGGSDFHGIKGKYPPRLGFYVLSVHLLNLW